jgi:hypothetical protein
LADGKLRFLLFGRGSLRFLSLLGLFLLNFALSHLLFKGPVAGFCRLTLLRQLVFLRTGFLSVSKSA